MNDWEMTLEEIKDAINLADGAWVNGEGSLNLTGNRYKAIAHAAQVKMVKWLKAHNQSGNADWLKVPPRDWQRLEEAMKGEGR